MILKLLLVNERAAPEWLQTLTVSLEPIQNSWQKAQCQMGVDPMSRRVTVKLVDDIDGQARAHETVEFSIDGVHYAIDIMPRSCAKSFRCGLSTPAA